MPRAARIADARGPRRSRSERAHRERLPRRPPAIFRAGVHALNVGLAAFAEPPRAHGATVTQLAWRPPAGGDRELGLLVARLEDDPDDPIGARVRSANETAIARIVQARPMLVDVRPAREVIARARRPHDPARGAADRVGADVRARAGRGRSAPSSSRGGRRAPRRRVGSSTPAAITFAPCHEHGAVGPMAGIVSPSMPVRGRRERRRGKSRVRDAQRGARPGAPVRGVRRLRARPPAVDGRDARPGARPRARAGRARRPQAHHGPGACRWATNATTGTWPRPRSSRGPSPRR